MTMEKIVKIEVMGTGCPKCDKLEETARAAADKLGINYEMHHIRDINEFVKRGVMATPALAVDGKISVTGRVPSQSELESLITSALAEAPESQHPAGS
jgi:small redox-active disulfide protein 2